LKKNASALSACHVKPAVTWLDPPLRGFTPWKTGKMVPQLFAEESPSSTTLQENLPSFGICLFEIRLVINQPPWTPPLSTPRFAVLMFFKPPSQIRGHSDV
jgi:hypothetical protein